MSSLKLKSEMSGNPTTEQPAAKRLPPHSIFWWSIKVVCGAALIASLFLMIIYDLNRLFSVPALLAQLLVISGGITSIWHYRLLKQSSKDIAEPSALVSESALFRWIRHPMYLADMVAYTGLFLIAPNALVIPPIIN